MKFYSWRGFAEKSKDSSYFHTLNICLPIVGFGHCNSGMANARMPDGANGETACSICMEPCQHPSTQPCERSVYTRGSNQDLKEKVTCPGCSGIFPENKAASIDPREQTNRAQTLCEKHRESLNPFCEEGQPPLHPICQESWDHESQTAIPTNQPAWTEGPGTRSPLNGWEESLPKSEPTSPAIVGPSNIKTDFTGKGEVPDGNEDDNKEKGLLIEQWVDFNLEENKQKDIHSNSRNQNSITWILLILFIIQIVGLVTTIFVFTKAKPSLPAAAMATPCCPHGWIMNQGNCYHVVDKERSWEEGQFDCSSHGATLAVINNLEKLNVAIYDKGPLNHWIGLFRGTGDGWRWPNGSVFNNFFDMGGDRQCAYLNNGTVNSTSCSVKKKSLCSQKVERKENDGRCWET